jgi:hypothetical protein
LAYLTVLTVGLMVDMAHAGGGEVCGASWRLPRRVCESSRPEITSVEVNNVIKQSQDHQLILAALVAIQLRLERGRLLPHLKMEKAGSGGLAPRLSACYQNSGSPEAHLPLRLKRHCSPSSTKPDLDEKIFRSRVNRVLRFYK